MSSFERLAAWNDWPTYWYAAMKDADDNDWGYGSEDLEEAKVMAQRLGPDAYVAAIKNGPDPVCDHIITQDEF